MPGKFDPTQGSSLREATWMPGDASSTDSSTATLTAELTERRAPRTCRTPRRRRPSRAILDLLRAISESPNYLMDQGSEIVAPPGPGTPDSAHAPANSRPHEFEDDTELEHSSRGRTFARASVPEPARAESIPASPIPSRITLFRSQMLDSSDQTEELHCTYCNRPFRLENGGASFEGKAACAECEPHLNRDVVLPAIGKMRQALAETGEACFGPADGKPNPNQAGPQIGSVETNEDTKSEEVSTDPVSASTVS